LLVGRAAEFICSVRRCRLDAQGEVRNLHAYQYRILLDYSVATKPSFPETSEMSAEQWNKFVDGFDVKGFAQQMADAKVGWVMFCIDDH
jgi:hypothetical protein